MIKTLYVMQENPDLSIAECQQHWYEVHGMLHSGPSNRLARYVQHHSLIAAYQGVLRPTHVGCSIVWTEDLAALERAKLTPAWTAAGRDGQEGLRCKPLFRYPIPCVTGEEIVVRDGSTTSLMMKAIFLLASDPHEEPAAIQDRWRNVRGPLASTLPGLRRYVQNHRVLAATAEGHYAGWEELWFDDYEALQRAFCSEAGFELEEKTYGAWHQTGIVIGRERVMPLTSASSASEARRT